MFNRHRSLPEIISTSPNTIRDDIKRLKLIELQLNDEVKGLAHQRDGLVMELQQLQEAKPVLERAYAVINLDVINQFWLLSSTKMFVFFSFLRSKCVANTTSQFNTAHPTIGTKKSSFTILPETTTNLYRINNAT